MLLLRTQLNRSHSPPQSLSPVHFVILRHREIVINSNSSNIRRKEKVELPLLNKGNKSKTEEEEEEEKTRNSRRDGGRD